MKKFNLITLMLFISIKSFTISFLDPTINRILVYVDKDSTNNYAFLKGLSDHQEKKTENFFSIGMVGSSITSRLEDKSNYSTVVPLINAKYKNFYTYGGIYNGYNFYEGKKLEMNFTAEYRFAGHKGDSFDSHFRDLPSVDDPVMLGIGGSYQIAYAFLTGSINHNIRGNSNENTASIGLLSGIPFKKFILLGYLNYELMSNSYSNQYFGIPSSSDSHTESYEIDGIGRAIRFTTVLAYSFSQNIDIFTYYYSEFFSDNIKKSPLVKKNNSSMIGLGATYTF